MTESSPIVCFSVEMCLSERGIARVAVLLPRPVLVLAEQCHGQGGAPLIRGLLWLGVLVNRLN